MTAYAATTLGHLPLDFRARWAISDAFRSSTALRHHLEASVLAPDRLSWTAFTALWVLWIWGEMESREFASAVGISRPTATGLLSALQRRRFLRRRKPRRTAGTSSCRSPRAAGGRSRRSSRGFNAEEAKVAPALSEEEQGRTRVASTLRTLLLRVEAA